MEIAIVGLAGCYAGARDVRAFWQNILDKVDAVTEAGPEWTGPYFEANTTASDRTYTTKGGFLRGLAEVNPLEFGVLPGIALGGDPDHLMALKCARDALRDGGYLDGGRSFEPERTGVVIGRGTYGNRAMAGIMSRCLFLDQAVGIARALRPDLSAADLDDLRHHFQSQLPSYNADMVGPTTPNVIAGLIANRLNLMGPNYIVDAACASALFALDSAVRELVIGRCDLMLAGAVQSHTPPQLYIQFSQIQALSRDKIRPFQTGADGILLGEGVGMLLLKRLADARRDGDRIYVVIQGIGLSSDGKAKGLLAPRVEGQVMALRHAYDSSGIDPGTVDLIEAHGTGTAVGDRTEIEALNAIFGGRGAGPQVAVGSVKSMIGHCLPAAGSASLIKTALALHHKVLPPTLCDEPNPELFPSDRPLYVNNHARPWIHGRPHPRRAGVNAFGFGGANAHVILEEYRGSGAESGSLQAPSRSELITLAAGSASELAQLAKAALAHLRGPAPASVAEIAHASTAHAQGIDRLAIVADGEADLASKLERAIEMLERKSALAAGTLAGIFLGSGEPAGRTCFLFPSEGIFPNDGTQYPRMPLDLCMQFPRVRECFDALERSVTDKGLDSRASFLFPAYSPPDAGHRTALELGPNGLDIGFESVFVASLAIFRQLDELGMRAQAVAGYREGMVTAFTARRREWFGDFAGCIQRVRDLIGIVGALEDVDSSGEGVLLFADALWPETRRQLLSRLDGDSLRLVADNCENQVTVFATADTAQAIGSWLTAHGSIVSTVPTPRTHYRPLSEAGVAALHRALQKIVLVEPGDVPVYSAFGANLLPADAEEACHRLAREWRSPVRLTETIAQLYQDGFRHFVEVGPGGMLTTLVRDSLRDKSDVMIAATDIRGAPGMRIFHQMLAQAFAAGVPFTPSALYVHRDIPDLELTAPVRAARPAGIRLRLLMPELSVPRGWRQGGQGT